jgi:CheY-like chemotaxis protein
MFLAANTLAQRLEVRGIFLATVSQVLIVDESAESREILRTLLARRGAVTIEALRPDEAAELTDIHRPDLILFDADSDRSGSGAATQTLQAAANRNGTPIVFLGTVRNAKKSPPSGQIVAKPYHYGPLIRKIEDLLAAG